MQGRYPCEITETDRFLIRELGVGDVDAYINLTEEEHAKVFIPEFRSPIEEKRERILDHIRYSYSFYECGIWGIFSKKQKNLLVGIVEITIPSDEITAKISEDRKLLMYELGFVTEKDYLGKGIAREAGKAAIEYAFDYLGADGMIISLLNENKWAVNTAGALHFNRLADDLYVLVKDKH